MLKHILKLHRNKTRITRFEGMIIVQINLHKIADTKVDEGLTTKLFLIKSSYLVVII